MKIFHHTLTDFGISLLLPAGVYPAGDASTKADIVRRPDAEDLSPDNPDLTMSLRRWRSDEMTGLSPTMCAHFHFYEFDDSHQWISESEQLMSDGVEGSIRYFSCHGGDTGFVATFDLVNEIVTGRATWPSDDAHFGDMFRGIVESARYLMAGDVMSAKTSILHPLIGISVVPGNWLVDEPEFLTLRIIRNSNIWLIHQMIELPTLDDSWVELPNIVGDPDNPIRLFRNADCTGISGLLDGDRPLFIEGLVTDPAEFDQLVRISESVRIHPGIHWQS